MSNTLGTFEVIGKKRASADVATLSESGRLMIPKQFQHEEKHPFHEKDHYVLQFDTAAKQFLVQFYDKKTDNPHGVIAFKLNRFETKSGKSTAYIELGGALKQFKLKAVPGKIKLLWDNGKDGMLVDVSKNVTKATEEKSKPKMGKRRK